MRRIAVHRSLGKEGDQVAKSAGTVLVIGDEINRGTEHEVLIALIRNGYDTQYMSVNDLHAVRQAVDFSEFDIVVELEDEHDAVFDGYTGAIVVIGCAKGQVPLLICRDRNDLDVSEYESYDINAAFQVYVMTMLDENWYLWDRYIVERVNKILGNQNEYIAEEDEETLKAASA